MGYRVLAAEGKQVITNVYLDQETYAALKKLSESTGAPMAHFFREGLKKVLEQHGITVPKARGKK
jgi:predicted DNA-binding protein